MQIDTSEYQQQLSAKIEKTSLMFEDFDIGDIEAFESPVSNYRMRAEFRVWHDGDDLYHIMFDQNSKQKYRVDQFAPASELINQLMDAIIQRLKPNPILRDKLFQIDYLSTLSGEAIVSLLYHKQLEDEWQQHAEVLQEQLRKSFNVSIIGRARKQKRVLDKDFVIEQLPIAGKNYVFKQIENSFTQPNASVNIKMIEWAQDCSKTLGGDLVELYCGAGNFSIPLAQYYDKVIGTEIAKPSVQAAQFNIEENGLNNVEIVRLSAEEFVTAMRGERSFNRLNGIDLTRYDIKTVLVDPPRAGLDIESVKLVSEFNTIIYISCNPITLRDNLEILCKTHEIKRFAVFDQFPYTNHVESGVLLVRKDAN